MVCTYSHTEGSVIWHDPGGIEQTIQIGRHLHQWIHYLNQILLGGHTMIFFQWDRTSPHAMIISVHKAERESTTSHSVSICSQKITEWKNTNYTFVPQHHMTMCPKIRAKMYLANFTTRRTCLKKVWPPGGINSSQPPAACCCSVFDTRSTAGTTFHGFAGFRTICTKAGPRGSHYAMHSSVSQLKQFCILQLNVLSS